MFSMGVLTDLWKSFKPENEEKQKELESRELIIQEGLFTNRIEELVVVLREREVKLSELNGQVTDLQKEKEHAKSSLDGLKTQLNCTKKELERMTSQMKSLEENLAKEKEQNKQLE